jgi:hypothetical protein
MFSGLPPKADIPAGTHGDGLHSKSNITRTKHLEAPGN